VLFVIDSVGVVAVTAFAFVVSGAIVLGVTLVFVFFLLKNSSWRLL
jgi:hypothetical protein